MRQNKIFCLYLYLTKKMKKSIIILLASFYLLIASGLTVSFHYCGGKLKYFSLFTAVDENGCCGSKMKSKGCCKNKTAFVKVKDNHQLSSKTTLPNNKPTEQLLSNNFSVYNFFTASSFEMFAVPDSHAPPDILTCPTFLLNKSIRI